MSQENGEIVRRAYESQAEGRLDDWFEFLDRDIEWRGPREFPDLVEPHFGHDDVARYIAKVNEAIDVYRMAPEQFIDASSDQVLVFSREGERGRSSGAEVQTHRPPTPGRSATARPSACRATGSGPRPFECLKPALFATQ
jgi:ketosteroid isomerase-like protein